MDVPLQQEAYKAGSYIFFEGDIESHFYIIKSGQVSIFSKDMHGKRFEIVKINEGESFGEFALLDKAPRSASAQAITDVVVVKVSEQGYEQLLKELPIWASSMMRSFTHRLKQMNDRIKRNY